MLSLYKNSLAFICRWYEDKPITGDGAIEGICMLLFVLL